jgi:hypothetical protein
MLETNPIAVSAEAKGWYSFAVFTCFFSSPFGGGVG